MTDYDAPTPPQEGIATLLRELGERDEELRYLRERVRRLTASRDLWRQRARQLSRAQTIHARRYVGFRRAA